MGSLRLRLEFLALLGFLVGLLACEPKSTGSESDTSAALLTCEAVDPVEVSSFGRCGLPAWREGKA